jgi:hypothetical protein
VRDLELRYVLHNQDIYRVPLAPLPKQGQLALLDIEALEGGPNPTSLLPEAISLAETGLQSFW